MSDLRTAILALPDPSGIDDPDDQWVQARSVLALIPEGAVLVTEAERDDLNETVALLDSMVAGREPHTAQSRAVVRNARAIIAKLREGT